jgi:hypothetical protein
VKPLARGQFADVVNLLPLRETIQKGGKRAEVESTSADVEQMVLNPHQLGENRADVFSPRRKLDVQQLFDGMEPGNLVRHGRDVIHAVDDRHILVEIEVFAQFLEAAVQIADVRDGVNHLFAFQRQQQAQRGVRRRVLRAEVQRPMIFALRRIGCHQRFDFSQRHDFDPVSRGAGLWPARHLLFKSTRWRSRQLVH